MGPQASGAVDRLGVDPYGALAGSFVSHYATLRGVVRLELMARQLDAHLAPPPASIVDVGGGAGHVSVPLAARGHEVTLLDTSPEMLRRARAAVNRSSEEVRRRVTLVQGSGLDGAAALGRSRFDAVLCHGVLMYLDDPEPCVRALAELCRPGGIVSVLAKNADALALRPALLGRFDDARAAFESDRDVGGLGVVTRGDTVDGLTRHLAASEVEVVAWYGVRVLTDHRIGEPPGGDIEDVVAAEWEAGRRDPYRGIARLIHVVGRKRSAGER
ncbi:methyltransferase domain-containing protein [soil metagenome]